MRALEAWPCQALCAWSSDPHVRRDGEPLFSCAACGSEWVPSEAWTPIDADGRIPVAVRDARVAAAAGTRGSGTTSGS